MRKKIPPEPYQFLKIFLKSFFENPSWKKNILDVFDNIYFIFKDWI